MNDTNNIGYPFWEHEIDWQELASIGILKDELELEGQLERLLSGEKTDAITMELVLLGVDVTMSATLQLVRKQAGVIIEINGIDSQE